MLNSKKIKTLLDKINWLSNSFEENNYTNISALEKSLLKEKVLMFYDEIENIATTKTQNRVAASVEKIEHATPKTEATKVVPISEPEPKPVKIEVVPKQVLEEIKPEPKLIPEAKETFTEPVKLVEEKTEEPAVKTAPEENIHKPEPTKAEKFQKTIAFQKQIVSPKRDLREIIDLNKSFIFKAELFNQNNDLYKQFVSEMNQTRSEDNAIILLNNWVMKMNWNKEENKAYELLERAVEKRFLPLI